MHALDKHTLLVEHFSIEELPASERELVLAARQATKNSYSPYSHFCVGCAIRLKSGEIVTGANHENASYGLAVCAERTAIFSVNNMGKRGEIAAIAVTGRPADAEDGLYVGGAPIAPCGACRQIIFESEQLAHAPVKVIMDGYSDSRISTVLSASGLLPLAFGPADLGVVL
jgi:cytidine deaminase